MKFLMHYWLAWILVVMLSGTGVVHAGSWSVFPLGLTLSAQQRSGTVAVRNAGREATVVQVELLAWSQAEGKDTYAATREILVTPPIFTIKPGEVQTIRVGLRSAIKTQLERSYRLFAREVPPPPKPGLTGLQMALQVAVPVFIVPDVPRPPALVWRLLRSQDGHLNIIAKNTGNVHVKLVHMAILTATNKQLSAKQDVHYVLPGQWIQWQTEVRVPRVGDKLRLVVKTNDGTSIESGLLPVERLP
jgi:fimbrial chaperone protein